MRVIFHGFEGTLTFFISVNFCGFSEFIVPAALRDDLNSATLCAVIMPRAEKVNSVSLPIKENEQ